MQEQLCRVCGITMIGRRSMAATCSKVCHDRLVYLNKRDDLLAARAERYANDPAYRWKIRIHQIAKRLVPELGPCERCGKPARHRHHPTDAKPYEIEQLCPGCHVRHHRANPGAELVERIA